MRRALLALASVAVIAGCTPSAAPGSAGRTPARGAHTNVELTVFAAASLHAGLADVERAYEAARPGTALTVSTDSSSALATRIEHGAPADVFLSADTTNPQRLVDAGLAAGAPVVFAANELTIVVPAGNPAGISSPADLATEGVKIIAAGAEVPITRYAAQLVENLADEPNYPTGFEAAYAENVVSREDNVSAVVAKITLGEGDAAIVYASDAASTTDVATIGVPDRAKVRASYAGIVVETSARQPEGATFLRWLAGPDGRAILGRFGFRPPSP